MLFEIPEGYSPGVFAVACDNYGCHLTPISTSKRDDDNILKITGIAATPYPIDRGSFKEIFPADVLKRDGHTLIGKPIVDWHSEWPMKVRLKDIIGEVVNTRWDEDDQALKFEGIIWDPNAIEVLRRKIMINFSPGYNHVYNWDNNGDKVSTDIMFDHLGYLNKPADKTAKLNDFELVEGSRGMRTEITDTDEVLKRDRDYSNVSQGDLIANQYYLRVGYAAARSNDNSWNGWTTDEIKKEYANVVREMLNQKMEIELMDVDIEQRANGEGPYSAGPGGICMCTKCGYEVERKERNIPCTDIICPNCKIPLVRKGVNNSDRAGTKPPEKEGSAKTAPKGFPEDRNKYGDPNNFKFPIHDKAHVRNALARFVQFQDQYTTKEKEYVWTRIVNAAIEFGIKHTYNPDNPLDKLLPESVKEKCEGYEERAAGNGPYTAGPGGKCVCPECGYETNHKENEPCIEISCPKCNTKLIRKDIESDGGGDSRSEIKNFLIINNDQMDNGDGKDVKDIIIDDNVLKGREIVRERSSFKDNNDPDGDGTETFNVWFPKNNNPLKEKEKEQQGDKESRQSNTDQTKSQIHNQIIGGNSMSKEDEKNTENNNGENSKRDGLPANAGPDVGNPANSNPSASDPPTQSIGGQEPGHSTNDPGTKPVEGQPGLSNANDPNGAVGDAGAKPENKDAILKPEGNATKPEDETVNDPKKGAATKSLNDAIKIINEKGKNDEAISLINSAVRELTETADGKPSQPVKKIIDDKGEKGISQREEGKSTREMELEARLEKLENEKREETIEQRTEKLIHDKKFTPAKREELKNIVSTMNDEAFNKFEEIMKDTQAFPGSRDEKGVMQRDENKKQSRHDKWVEDKQKADPLYRPIN